MGFFSEFKFILVWGNYKNHRYGKHNIWYTAVVVCLILFIIEFTRFVLILKCSQCKESSLNLNCVQKFDLFLFFSGPGNNNGPDSHGDGGRNVQKIGTKTDIGHTQRVSYWNCVRNPQWFSSLL